MQNRTSRAAPRISAAKRSRSPSPLRGEKPATGTIAGNTITIDVGVTTGFGAPLDGKTLYSVTGLTFGRSNSVDDLYFDVDATEAFDYVLGSSTAK